VENMKNTIFVITAAELQAKHSAENNLKIGALNFMLKVKKPEMMVIQTIRETL
jgi:hypothetical protein